MRAIELRCLELLDQRTRTLADLERSPRLATILAEQRRREDEQRHAAAQAESARNKRLTEGLAAIDRALSSDDLDHAQHRGLWSNACFVAIEQRGWSESRRAAPLPGRGVIWARPRPDAPFEVVSSLDTPQWQPGQTVRDQLARRAPLLKAPSTRTRAA